MADTTRFIDRWECEECREPSSLHEGFSDRWYCWDHGYVRMIQVRYAEVGPTGKTLGHRSTPSRERH